MRFLLISAGLLAGCGAAVPQASPESCNASAYADLIGKGAAASLAVPQPKRVYVIGEPVTADIVPERVNIELDDTDTIFSIACG